MLRPMAFQPSTEFSDWSIILDRRGLNTTVVSFRGVTVPNTGIDIDALGMDFYFLEMGTQRPNDRRDNTRRMIGFKPVQTSDPSLDASYSASNYSIRDVGESTELSSTITVTGDQYGPLSVIALGGGTSWDNRDAWLSPEQDAMKELVNLQVPITNYTDPILLFTKEFPGGAPITPEELKQLERPAAAGQPAALAPVTQDASP